MAIYNTRNHFSIPTVQDQACTTYCIHNIASLKDQVQYGMQLFTAHKLCKTEKNLNPLVI